VRYESAHLEGVASEKIVRSTHSTQSTPATILEVRRILYEHLGIACGLECEVPERVEAAMASSPKTEPLSFSGSSSASRIPVPLWWLGRC
jgi:hypothetical protein